MKAIGYIRVSTSYQVNDGVSLESQENKIRAWADLNGYNEVLICKDAGISGKRADNRAGLQEALSLIEKNDVLVVYSLSRLARSTKDTIEISELLQKKEADLVSISEKIDTTSAAGKMVFRMLAVLNEFERDQTSERVKTAMQYKKEKGERVGHIPFGYRLDTDNKHLIQDEKEQWILREIQVLKGQGLSLREIAKELNNRGIDNRGHEWNHVSVKRVAKL